MPNNWTLRRTNLKNLVFVPKKTALGERRSMLCRMTVFHVNNYKNFPELNDIPADVYEQIEIEARYAGYIKRQLADIEVFKKDEKLRLRDDIDYSKIGGLSREMVAKLSKVKPATVGEASRIPGVTPAAITAVLGYVKR